MQQIQYSFAGTRCYHANPLLQAVAAGIAELLPLTDCESWPQPLLELLAAIEHPDTALMLPPPLVVVVGWCPTMTEQATTLLRASGLAVACCATGEAAVQLVRQRVEQVALVVADQQLDGRMDGFGLARALGLLWPGVPVLLAVDQAAPASLPIAVTTLAKPWLPLDLLIEAQRAMTRPVRSLN